MTGSRTKLEAIGANLRRLREMNGLTKLEVAAAVKLDDSQYSKMERGRRGTSIEKYEKLAKKFGVSLVELFTPGLRAERRSASNRS